MIRFQLVNTFAITMRHEARYYVRENENFVRCGLCPHACLIKPGEKGICGVRENVSGSLISLSYGNIIAASSDPVEKKPLYHFYPGSRIFSVGTTGCNLKCFFCQNHRISQPSGRNTSAGNFLSPKDLLHKVLSSSGDIGIAYTYNEPTIFAEYIVDSAILFKEADYKTVVVSNGFTSVAAMDDLLSVTDAFNIDLKSFDQQFYSRYTSSFLSPVLKNLEKISHAGKHLEITFLVVPGLNDNELIFGKMIKWISDHLGCDQVLHISRYFPACQSDIPPTPLTTMDTLYEIAKDKLHYVYPGNVVDSEKKNTLCPACGRLAIERSALFVNSFLSQTGNCPECGYKIV